jgi:excisionase family DNA binding protein
VPQRTLTLADVCEALNISSSQAYALVRSGDLRAFQLGGRNIWRVEATELEAYIQRMYDETRDRLERERENPHRDLEVAPAGDDDGPADDVS